jgi:AraC-like DNA-binding protein
MKKAAFSTTRKKKTNDYIFEVTILICITESGFSELVIQFIITRNNDELGELTVSKIAHKFRISPSHLYHLFQSEKGVPPGKFLIMIKMLRAAMLLEQQDVPPIKKVSKKMGFSSTNYFIKIFKEYFGTTPGKYREYIRNKSWTFETLAQIDPIRYIQKGETEVENIV